MSDHEFNDSETLPIDLLSGNDKILKQIKLKIDAITEKLTEHGQKFNEISDKLQSMENMISKISKTDEDIERKDTVAKQAAPKSFVLKHTFENVENFVKGKVINVIWKITSMLIGNHYITVNTVLDGPLKLKSSLIEVPLKPYCILNRFVIFSCIVLQRLNDHLACFVSIRGPKEEIKWSVETKVDIKIVGPNQKSKAESCNHIFEINEGWGFPKFLEWEEMKNEYLVDGKLTVEANVQIMESSGFSKEKIQKFDYSTKEDSDVVLVVKEKEFYVLRKYLAAQSSFFKALLLGDTAESKKPKVTLTGIDPDDFHYFLEVLYGELAIDEYNIEGILLLANTYDAKTAIRRCENFLLNESKKPLKKKLQMAVRYNLENLKNKCMEEIQTFHQLSSVIPADINDLDHKLMGDLLKKAIHLH